MADFGSKTPPTYEFWLGLEEDSDSEEEVTKRMDVSPPEHLNRYNFATLRRAH